MTRFQERLVDTPSFRRRKATEDTKRKIADWAVWECADPEFQYDYERTVSLFVHEGAAILTFADGETVDLQPGDFLTIERGARAHWMIPVAIRNSYCDHLSTEIADNRNCLTEGSFETTE